MDESLGEFVAAAKAQGAQDEFLAGLLRQRGWPARDVQAAFAAYYETRTGLQIPARPGSSESARDAFLYLLAFTTLSIWAWGLVSLIFTLLDIWMPDPVLGLNPVAPWRETMTIASADMARLLIAFPAFLLTMSFIGRSEREAGARSASPVARWLTYISLFIAATTVIIDLVVAVEYLLRGEFTWRFVCKVLTVIVTALGIGAYFFDRLRSKPSAQRPFQKPLAVATCVVVVVVTGVGLRETGSPSAARAREADFQRVADLMTLDTHIQSRWTSGRANPQLPADLNEIVNTTSGLRTNDPETGKQYEYHPSAAEGDPQYQLCATFAAPGGPRTEWPNQPRMKWRHPGGRHCYSLRATGR